MGHQRNDDIAIWLNLGANIVIAYMTYQILVLNRQNVHNGAVTARNICEINQKTKRKEDK